MPLLLGLTNGLITTGSYTTMKFIFLVPLLIGTGEAIGDVVPWIRIATEVGALGVLAWVAYSQRQELTDLRKENQSMINQLLDRWNGWETIRHADSAILEKALRELSSNCAAVNELKQIRQAHKEP